MRLLLGRERPRWLPRAIAMAVTELIGVLITASTALNDPRPFRALDAVGYLLLIAASAAPAVPRRWAPAAFAVSLGCTAGYQAAGYPTHAPYFSACSSPPTSLPRLDGAG